MNTVAHLPFVVIWAGCLVLFLVGPLTVAALVGRASREHHQFVRAQRDRRLDTASSHSRQHFIDTGRYLTVAEAAEPGWSVDDHSPELDRYLDIREREWQAIRDATG